jgi:hypothetical protein
MKIRPVGASCSMRTDGRTNMTQLTVAVRYFAKAPKKRVFLFEETEMISVATGKWCLY